MKPSRRWKAWIVAAFGVLAALVLFDLGRRMLAADDATPVRTPIIGGKYEPAFKVGEKAPDFTLPDSHGKPHRLSDLVRRDTLLCFTCGCANCIDLQTFTGLMLKRLGNGAPDVITVSTMPTDREETYFRDTRLKQRLLYERKGGPVMAEYQGHPCPRVYRLGPDRTVAWIGSSPGASKQLDRVRLELAAQLTFTGTR